jgi:hypothetical protein
MEQLQFTVTRQSSTLHRKEFKEMLPSTIAASKGSRAQAPSPGGDLTLTSGVQGVVGASGLTGIFLGDSDDYYYIIPELPFPWYFMGTNYGQGGSRITLEQTAT